MNPNNPPTSQDGTHTMNDKWEVRPCRDRLGNVTSYDICLPQEPGSTGVAVVASVYSGEAVANQIVELWNKRASQ
jgi:hypothetical protein